MVFTRSQALQGQRDEKGSCQTVPPAGEVKVKKEKKVKKQLQTVKRLLGG